MKLVIALCFALLLFSGETAVADEASFSKAVSVYLRGFQECIDANTLKSQDLAQAKLKYDYYLAIKNEASAIDSTILASSDRDMAKNIEHCEKVRINLAKAEAGQMLDAAFSLCEFAQQQLDQGDLRSARQKMTRFMEKKEKALQITEHATDSFQINSGLKNCAKIESKLAEAETKENQMLVSANGYVKALDQAVGGCRQWLAKYDVGAGSFEFLDSAKSSFEVNKKARADAWLNIERAMPALQSVYSEDEKTSVQTLKAKDLECDKKASGLLSSMETEQKHNELVLAGVSSALLKALDGCKSAARMLAQNNFDDSSLPRVKGMLQESVQLANSADANADARTLMRKYPKWSKARSVNDQRQQLQLCQNDTAALLSKKEKLLSEQKKSENAKLSVPPPAPTPSAKKEQFSTELTQEKLASPGTEKHTAADNNELKKEESWNAKLLKQKSVEPGEVDSIKTAEAKPATREKSWKDQVECRRRQLFPCN